MTHLLHKYQRMCVGAVVLAGLNVLLLGCSGQDIRWRNTASLKFEPLLDYQIPDEQAQIVFYRLPDNLPAQTAVNLAINNQYLASLLSGNYTDVMVCAQRVDISTTLTEQKTNYLMDNRKKYQLDPNTTSYFEIKVASDKQVHLIPKTSATAIEALQSMPKQSHTLSRIHTKRCYAY